MEYDSQVAVEGIVAPSGHVNFFQNLEEGEKLAQVRSQFGFSSYSNFKNIFFSIPYTEYHRYIIRWAVNINCCKFINLTLSLLIFNLLRSSKLLTISLEQSFLIGICALYLNYPFVPFCLRVGWASCYIKNNVGIGVRLAQCKPYFKKLLIRLNIFLGTRLFHTD